MMPKLFRGWVFHARLRPKRHAFRYRVFFLRFPLSQLQRLENAVFSINRWNLFSFYYRDHGARDGSHPLAWIRHLLRKHGLHEADGEVWLQTFPRMLGYVFNPVSFWLCNDRDGALRAVVCEVNNTFGERHLYLLAHPDHRPIRDCDRLTSRKVFHVSPFCEVSGAYRFQFNVAEPSTRIRIDYDGADGNVLLTSVTGRGANYHVGTLLRAFAAYPGMTFGVMARIHLQALKLWVKGLPWVAKPAPPSKELTR